MDQVHKDCIRKNLVMLCEKLAPEPLHTHLIADGVFNEISMQYIKVLQEKTFTMNACIGDCENASKWVSLISMVLSTLSDAKHQGKISQTLIVNGPGSVRCGTPLIDSAKCCHDLTRLFYFSNV